MAQSESQKPRAPENELDGVTWFVVVPLVFVRVAKAFEAPFKEDLDACLTVPADTYPEAAWLRHFQKSLPSCHANGNQTEM
eukprot:5314941-Amphidinium_carterae.1